MRSPGGDASPTPEDGTRRPRLAKRRCPPRWTHPSRAECGLLVMNEWATASKHVVQVSTKQKWHEDPGWRDVDLVGTSRCSNTCCVWSGRCIRPCPQTEGPRVCSLHPLAQQSQKPPQATAKGPPCGSVASTRFVCLKRESWLDGLELLLRLTAPRSLQYARFQETARDGRPAVQTWCCLNKLSARSCPDLGTTSPFPHFHQLRPFGPGLGCSAPIFERFLHHGQFGSPNPQPKPT